MNPLYIIWMVLFASFCSSQTAEPLSKSIINTDSEDTIRCDTYLCTQTHQIAHTWAIRHFSIYEDNSCQIYSPKLRAPTNDKLAWDITIVPDGKDGKNEAISLYVNLHQHEAIADVDVSIKNHKNETVHSMKMANRKMGTSFSPICWENFCKKDDEFRTKMLQNDTLTLSINIRWYAPTYETVHNISHRNKSAFVPENRILKCNLLENFEWILQRPSLVDMILSSNASNYIRCDKCIDVQVHEIKFIWAIHNFSVHETFGYKEIFSPNLQAPTTDKYIWFIKLTPNGNHDERGRGHYIGLDVYLSEKSNATQALAKHDISVINLEKQILQNIKSPAQKLRAGNSVYWRHFCKKSYPFRSVFLNNNTLTLFIHIKWITEPFKVNVSHQRDTSLPAATSEPNLTKCCNISQMLESMLENLKFADVVFTTNGSSYPAHKNILAARSPVFATMFQEKEQKHGKNKNIGIKVTHMSEDVLRAMLRYIYTGKCENLGKLADKLFVAAVKYDLDGLRDICERALCKTVSAENAATMLEFAEKHHATELKSKAMKLIGIVSDPNSNTTIH